MQPLENLNAESGTQQELESAGSLTPNEGSMENQSASGNCITLIKFSLKTLFAISLFK